MFDSAREAFFYTLSQWVGLGAIVFLIAYLGARLGFQHARRESKA
jgi:hypothetical protein